MQKFKFFTLFFLVLIFFLTGCAKRNPLSPVKYSIPTSDNNYVYVLNQPFGGQGYVSRINLDSGYIENKYITTGSIPNDIAIYNFRCYIANAGSDNMQIYNVLTGKSTYVNFSENSSPEMLDIYNGKIYVSLWKSSKLSVIDINSESIITNINIPTSTSGPWGIKVVNDKIFVACNGTYISWGNPANYTDGKIIVLNAFDYSTAKTFNNITNANGLTVDDSGNVYCAATGQYNKTGKIYKIDTGLNISLVLDTEKNANYIAYNADNNSLYISDSSWMGTDGVYKISGFLSTVYADGNHWARVNFATIKNEYKGLVCNSAGEVYIFKSSDSSQYSKYSIGGNPVYAVYAKY